MEKMRKMQRKKMDKWCDGLWVWKRKENVVVSGDDDVVGWQGVSVVTVDQNERGERRKQGNKYLIKWDEKKKTMFR